VIGAVLPNLAKFAFCLLVSYASFTFQPFQDLPSVIELLKFEESLYEVSFAERPIPLNVKNMDSRAKVSRQDSPTWSYLFSSHRNKGKEPGTISRLGI